MIAAGVDVITVDKVKRCKVARLASLFTSTLYNQVLSSEWFQCKMTLLPKSEHLRDPGNWRSITIGSAMQPLFHRILISYRSRLYG